jgi:hypothetical protein
MISARDQLSVVQEEVPGFREEPVSVVFLQAVAMFLCSPPHGGSAAYCIIDQNCVALRRYCVLYVRCQ